MANSTCSLNQWALDWDGNLDRILESIRIAKREGARLRVGPELEISGYDVLDGFLEMDVYQHSWEMLAKILSDEDCHDILIVGPSQPLLACSLILTIIWQFTCNSLSCLQVLSLFVPYDLSRKCCPFALNFVSDTTCYFILCYGRDYAPGVGSLNKRGVTCGPFLDTAGVSFWLIMIWTSTCHVTVLTTYSRTLACRSCTTTFASIAGS